MIIDTIEQFKKQLKWLTLEIDPILTVVLNHMFFYVEFQDINDIELKDLQTEICPRISANDLVKLLHESPDRLIVIDLRSNLEFKRAYIEGSVNIPFTSVLLGDIRLESLAPHLHLETLLSNKIVVVVSCLHENSVLVSSYFYQSHILRKFAC